MTQPTIKPSRWLMQTAKHARKWVTLSVIVGLVNGILLILQASLLAHIVNGAFITHMPRNLLMGAFIGLLVLIAVRAGLTWVREVIGFHASATVRTGIRQQLFDHLNALGPIRAQQLGVSGQLSSQVIEQVESLHGFFAQYLPQMALAVLLPVVILCFVFPLSWLGGLILLITAPLIPLFMALIGMGAASLNQKHFQTLARLSANFLDRLQGLTTLKYFHRAKDQLGVIAQVSDDYRQTTMSVLKIAFLSSAVLELFSSVSIALLATILGLSFLGYIDIGHYSGVMTLTTGLFILLLAPDFYLPLRDLGTHYHARAEAVGAAEEILKVLQTLLPEQGTQSDWDANQKMAIRFDKVNFTYPGRKPTLVDFTATFAAGSKTAIVGPSGAGKSTLLNVLLRWIVPGSGDVHINEQVLSTLSADSWYAQLGWIGQTPKLFVGSVRDNIVLAKPDASDAAVQQAIEQAGLTAWIATLPQGIETLIAEANVGVSGGQAQRIALARIFLKDAPVLLLDEPTASLDATTEREVLSRLWEFAQHKTVIMLTHRLTDLDKMDQVIVLDEGEIVAQGPFAELQKTCALLKLLLKQEQAYA